MQFQEITGSVAAPKAFTAGGIHCGIRKNRTKRDLALIACEVPCAAAAVYTQNKVKGAPIEVTRRNLQNGRAQAVICNSGNANTCNPNGQEIAWEMCVLTAKVLGIAPEDVVVASTGVIGQPLDITPIVNGIGPLADCLSKQGGSLASEAILTTDLVPKEMAITFELRGKTCTLGAIAKGSGMIHPNMATMLGFLTTDVAITPPLLHKALLASVQDTYNMVSVDGDTSTNDMVSILASGLAGNPEITEENEDYQIFCAALDYVNHHIAKMMAADGEGATKLLIIEVKGAKDNETARVVAKSVCTSSLFKAAMFGADANWGRVLCAIGYAPAEVDINGVDVTFASSAGSIQVCRGGRGLPFDEAVAKQVLLQKEITVNITLQDGDGAATAYGCDLTYDYVKINGDYRT